MKCFKSICLFGFVTVLSTWTFAGDVFVNNQTGNDAQDGSSIEQAVQTLKRAVKLCAAGDTLHLANTGGEYHESLSLGSLSGTPSAPIIVEGNGAVLSGLMPFPIEQWKDRGNGLYFFSSTVRKQMSAARPYVLWNGKLVPQRKTPADVAAEECCWNNEGIHFRVANGKKIADYKLEGTGRISGLILSGGSYIEVRNLICERFANDGFNVHGSCQGLVFRNIVGRWNGDDGFSIHEDVGAVVFGGHFHHNDYGIQDIDLSRSSFYGVLVENNRRAGADFHGGVHTLIDSVIRHNAGPQIQLSQDRTKHMRIAMGPVTDGMLIMKNTLSIGGEQGVSIRAGKADISNCTFIGAKTGALISPETEVEMIGNAFYGCKNQELVSLSKSSILDANLYTPGRISWMDQAYESTAFEAYQKASGQDAGSIVIKAPTLAEAKGFSLFGHGLSYGRRHIQPGIKKDLTFPFGEPVLNTMQGLSVASKSLLKFDFETSNPWSRVYPSPEKNKAGQTVVGTAKLSEEQSRSGKKSVKLDVSFPAGQPGPWLVKLFSVRLPAAKPVTEIKFVLFGDDSGMFYQPRIRDGSGECFYGPAGKMDWKGWRKITWDLSRTAPVSIHSGDGNKRQDGPTMELVLELKPEISAEGGELILYLDDLTIRLEE